MASAATHPAVRPFGKSALEPIGGGRFQHGDVVVDARGPWWTVRAPALSVENQPIDWLARPGLWKLEPALGDVQVCDLPAQALGLDQAGGDGEELFDWLCATRHGEIPPSSVQPGIEIEPGELTARIGPFTCQGQWQPMSVGEHRTFVDFPLVTISASISEPRRAWLRAVALAAGGLRMVRVGIDAATETVHARVDLTGCPSRFLEGLLDQAVAYSRATAIRLLPALSVLTDANVVSRALESGALAPTQTEGKS